MCFHTQTGAITGWELNKHTDRLALYYLVLWYQGQQGKLCVWRWQRALYPHCASSCLCPLYALEYVILKFMTNCVRRMCQWHQPGRIIMCCCWWCCAFLLEERWFCSLFSSSSAIAAVRVDAATRGELSWSYSAYFSIEIFRFWSPTL